MKNRRRTWFAILPALLAGCGSASEPEPPAAAAASSGSEQPPPTAAEPITPSDLNGTWVEYWAVDGKADTERYAFDEPGRFTWHASKDTESQAVGKAGAFRLEPHGKATFLVLQVEQETFVACDAPCTEGGAPREVNHRTPLVERYELGECPSNPEAKSLDASYTCRAFGGKAFWRKTHEPSASQPTAPAATAPTAPTAG